MVNTCGADVPVWGHHTPLLCVRVSEHYQDYEGSYNKDGNVIRGLLSPGCSPLGLQDTANPPHLKTGAGENERDEAGHELKWDVWDQCWVMMEGDRVSVFLGKRVWEMRQVGRMVWSANHWNGQGQGNHAYTHTHTQSHPMPHIAFLRSDREPWRRGYITEFSEPL